MKILRLTEHPLIMPHIDGMKSEIIKYQALVKSIKPLDQRKDAKGKDTFVLSDWWRCNSGELPHFAFVLRAVLTNAPNSCPPERLFSMFNARATFGEDQQRRCHSAPGLRVGGPTGVRQRTVTLVSCRLLRHPGRSTTTTTATCSLRLFLSVMFLTHSSLAGSRSEFTSQFTVLALNKHSSSSSLRQL